MTSSKIVNTLITSDSDIIELKTFTMIDKIKEEICHFKLSIIRAFRENEESYSNCSFDPQIEYSVNDKVKIRSSVIIQGVGYEKLVRK
ncbi:hypothetical protein BpHYR1_025260 [Brachionus plicatilis]|uniref:Uncharacterized protein n=1 Tax=Brachionus plicatilis TaxID=10195 RepID=A0A3M7RU59_BRAPC|nr:hypothetical protein BpHYR1_025260 [Brachionus plicatilis]